MDRDQKLTLHQGLHAPGVFLWQHLPKLHHNGYFFFHFKVSSNYGDQVGLELFTCIT